MEIGGRTVVVTGGAGGIGRALVRRFHAAGARAVVVADRDGPAAVAVANELAAERPGSAIAVRTDVGDRASVEELVERTTEVYGPIDLFCANAGIAVGTDPLATPEADWEEAWRVNVGAHVHAARALLPDWLDHGEGYLVVTASAAGLLTQLGSAPYTVTKHAAVAFAEWLAITYGDQGVRVSCVCPQGVNTAMLDAGTLSASSRAAVRAAGAVLEPEVVADAVLAGIAAEEFLILPHPEVREYWQRKAADTDRWLAGMRRLQAGLPR